MGRITYLLICLAVFMFLPAHSVGQPGFQSINCGGNNFTDNSTSIQWTSDNGFVDHGKTAHIEASLQNAADAPLRTLRFFPKDPRNKKFCYSLSVNNGSTYLVRASFLYGNYDALNKPPSFVLLLNYGVWDSINVTAATSTQPIVREIIYISYTDGLSVCLAPDSTGTPFISTLELRTLNLTMYKGGTSGSSGGLNMGHGLKLAKRINYGARSSNAISDVADERQRCKRAFVDRLRSMVQGAGPNDTARIGARCSEWAQWKDINKLVDKDMIKSIWRGVPDDNISKGRLKLSQCANNEIKENGERIFLDVMGQPMHHQNCPLWFAKMLYCHFVLQRKVDFSSRAPHLLVEDIRSSTITVTREELGLALQGAACEVHDAKEELQTQLHDIRRGLLLQLRCGERVKGCATTASEGGGAVGSQIHSNHCTPQHYTPPPHVDTYGGPCPICHAFFHNWSGHYVLPCGHMFHVYCLMQSMMVMTKCTLCDHQLSEHLYTMFKMSSEYQKLIGASERDVVETIVNLNSAAL